VCPSRVAGSWLNVFVTNNEHQTCSQMVILFITSPVLKSSATWVYLSAIGWANALLHSVPTLALITNNDTARTVLFFKNAQFIALEVRHISRNSLEGQWSLAREEAPATWLVFDHRFSAGMNGITLKV
jgi:hypothetical protein